MVSGSKTPVTDTKRCSEAIARGHSVPDNGTLLDDAKTTTDGGGLMEGSSGPSKWTWLVPIVCLVFLILSLSQGAILASLGWLCLLVNGVLVASGVHTRSRALSYLAPAFVLLGLLFLVASVVRDF